MPLLDMSVSAIKTYNTALIKLFDFDDGPGHFYNIQELWYVKHTHYIHFKEDMFEHIDHIGYYPELLIHMPSPYWRRMCDWKIFIRKRSFERILRTAYINYTMFTANEYYRERDLYLRNHKKYFANVLEDIKERGRGFNTFVISTMRNKKHILHNNVDIILHIQNFI